MYELLSLSERDILIAASDRKIDKGVFLEEIKAKEVAPLAAIPVTLNFLISEFSDGSILGNTKSIIYENGCKSMCKEFSANRIETRFRGSLNSDERLWIAGYIAAVMTFGNKASIAMGDEIQETSIAIGDLRSNSIGRVDNDDAIREVMDTALFKSNGLNLMGWTHQTFREFLTAWFLKKRGLEKEQILQLISYPVMGKLGIVP